MNSPKPPQPKEKSPFCHDIEEVINFINSHKIVANGQIEAVSITRGIDGEIYLQLK